MLPVLVVIAGLCYVVWLPVPFIVARKLEDNYGWIAMLLYVLGVAIIGALLVAVRMFFQIPMLPTAEEAEAADSAEHDFLVASAVCLGLWISSAIVGAAGLSWSEYQKRHPEQRPANSQFRWDLSQGRVPADATEPERDDGSTEAPTS